MEVTLVISVCMATYNGSRWIEQQIHSILSQLGKDDELIIVDDASTDDTLIKIRQMADSRIRLFSNGTNRGVDNTFQRALSLADGDILFLSDQDDIWHPEKVLRIMQSFQDDPDITLVLSDARIIDSSGRATADSYFGIRGRFIPGVFTNILKCKFLGCAMAIRTTMRDAFLPFPEKIPGHDMWIGIVNEYYGKSYYISEPLIDYRRHDSNTSPEKRQGIIKMIIWRWQLAVGLLKRILRSSSPAV